MSLGLELIWETAWPIFLNFCIESFNQIIRNTAKRIFEKRSGSFKNRQKLRFLAIFGVFGKISRKRLQRFFRFYAWSSCPIVGRNWRSQISQEKSGSFKNGPNVVKNYGFSPLPTICAHIWHIFKFRNGYSSVFDHSAQTRWKRMSFPGRFCVLTAVNMRKTIKMG